MGVTGVPCFIFEGKHAVMGAQPPDMLADALRQLAAMKQAQA
jgi:predicted DsbA family dithiol-disulfide isomerase